MNYKIQRPLLSPTFDVPAREELLAVKKNWHVKLCFTDNKGNNGERMWVKLKEKIDAITWAGTLDNSPLLIKTRKGARVTFHPYDVMGIIPPKKGRQQ